MPNEAGTETTETRRGLPSDTADAIRFAQDHLARAAAETVGHDPEIVEEIGALQRSLEAFLPPLESARAVTGDAPLEEATGALALQRASFRTARDRIKRVASDVRTAPGIGGYLEGAVSSIAQAEAFLAELV